MCYHTKKKGTTKVRFGRERMELETLIYTGNTSWTKQSALRADADMAVEISYGFADVDFDTLAPSCLLVDTAFDGARMARQLTTFAAKYWDPIFNKSHPLFGDMVRFCDASAFDADLWSRVSSGFIQNVRDAMLLHYSDEYPYPNVLEVCVCVCSYHCCKDYVASMLQHTRTRMSASFAQGNKRCSDVRCLLLHFCELRQNPQRPSCVRDGAATLRARRARPWILPGTQGVL